MLASLSADAVMCVHFLWIGFAVFGGLVVFKWRWIAWVHALVVVWSAAVITAGWICPLTPLENHLRGLAGQAGFEGGFIEHYLTAVIYPDGLTRPVQITLGVSMLAWNVLVYAFLFQYLRRSEQGEHREP